MKESKIITENSNLDIFITFLPLIINTIIYIIILYFGFKFYKKLSKCLDKYLNS